MAGDGRHHSTRDFPDGGIAAVRYIKDTGGVQGHEGRAEEGGCAHGSVRRTHDAALAREGSHGHSGGGNDLGDGVVIAHGHVDIDGAVYG